MNTKGPEKEQLYQLNDISFKILENTEQKVVFLLSGVDISVANALRRIMLAEVPTIAIETVEFYENTTALPDEFIAHRLGLIPLTMPKEPDKFFYNSV